VEATSEAIATVVIAGVSVVTADGSVGADTSSGVASVCCANGSIITVLHGEVAETNGLISVVIRRVGLGRVAIPDFAQVSIITLST